MYREELAAGTGMLFIYPGEGMRALANSQGLVGVLSLLFNQVGGRLTDATGRKAGLLVGPLLNVVLGHAIDECGFKPLVCVFVIGHTHPYYVFLWLPDHIG